MYWNVHSDTKAILVRGGEERDEPLDKALNLLFYPCYNPCLCQQVIENDEMNEIRKNKWL